MANADALDIALAGCLGRTDALRRKVSQYERRYRERTELPGTLLLLRALLVLLNEADERLLETHAQAQGEKVDVRELTRRELAETVKTYEGILGYCLNGVAAIHGRDFDPFVRPLSRLARSVADNTEIIFRPVAHHTNYEITLPLNAPIALQLSDADPSLRTQIAQLPTIVYLNYPASEELDCLHHLLIGHELGHLALRRRLPHLTGPVGDALPRVAVERYKTKLLAQQPQPSSQDLELLQLRVTNWFIELACDDLGLKLVGPGYFVALFEHAALTEWFYTAPAPGADNDRATYNRYPAMAWRVGRLWRQVEAYLPSKESSLPGTRETRDVLKSFHAAIPTWRHLEKAPEARIIRDAMHRYRTIAPTLLTAKEASYPPERFLADLPLVWAKLDKNIAPAERILSRRGATSSTPDPWRPAGQKRDPMKWSEPIAWRSILNGGYLYWLHQAQQHEQPTGRSAWKRQRESRAQACVLLQGSVELSEIHRQAVDLRNELSALSEVRVPS